MKTSIKRLSKSTVSVVLAVLMVLSSFSTFIAATTSSDSVGATSDSDSVGATIDTESIGADYSGYTLRGSFNSWSDSDFFSSDGTKTVSLTNAGNYTFKIHNGSQWCGKDNTTISATSTITYVVNGGADINLNVTTAGDYVFSLSDNNKLTVTYPSVEPTTEPTTTNLYLMGGSGNGSNIWGDWDTKKTGYSFNKDSDGYVYSQGNLDLTNKNSTYFRFHNGSNQYGPNSTSANVQVSDNSDNPTGTKKDNVSKAFYIQGGINYKNLEIHVSSDLSKIWITYSKATPIADSVTLNAYPTSLTVGETSTLTATLNNQVSDLEGKDIKYTLYDSADNEVETKTSSTGSATFAVTKASAGEYKYYVVASTETTDASGNAYGSVTSSKVTVTYGDLGLYYSSNISNSVSGATWTEVTGDTASFSTGLSTGDTFEFALSDRNSFNSEYKTFEISDEKSEHATITKTFKTVEIGGESKTITTYSVTRLSGCTVPTVYIDKTNSTLYAKADFSATKTKTTDSSETVTYYFAKPVSETDKFKTSGGSSDGLQIHYWNNSLGNGAQGDADVITPVYRASDETKSNKIYVNTKSLYNGSKSWDGETEFLIYSVELPIWATSFRFMGSNNNLIDVSGVGGDYSGYASLSLNPNRVYLVYEFGGNHYAAGIVLDDSLWDSDGENKFTTKTVKSNYIDYAGPTSANSGSYGINYESTNSLTKIYNNLSYSNPLYFGDFNPDTNNGYGEHWYQNSLYSYAVKNNLAQRDNSQSYFASIQGLVAEKLSGTKNQNGYGTLQGYNTSGNTVTMPLFDYDSLSKNSGVAATVAQGLDFPFYVSDFNGIKTYSYDSATDYNRIYSNENFAIDEGKYATGKTGDGKVIAGYFPVGDPQSSQYDKHTFSTEFDIDFYMTTSGKLTGKDSNGNTVTQDICFNFSGDDDVWVYVDDVLVLDLGGDHKLSAATINFSDMKVYYKSAANDTSNVSGTSETWATDSNYVSTVDLNQILAANGVNFNNTDATKSHKLQMFYVERGIYESNASISFNLPQSSGLNVENDVKFNKINEGLKPATKLAANKDYFNYTLNTSVISSSDLDILRGTYSSLGTRTTDLTTFGIDTTLLNPLLNNVTRTVGNTSYTLASSNNTVTQQSSSNYLTNSDSNIISNVNYILNDGSAKGDGDVSGRTGSDSKLSLLYDQTAKFENVVPINSLVGITQSGALGAVDTSGTVISETSSDRIVADYYTTKYSIYDPLSRKYIQNSTDGSVAKDTDITTDGFYFANYADGSDTVTMNVSYENTVIPGSLKIVKELDSKASASYNNQTFYFTVKFGNILGQESSLQEYSNLSYQVYDSQNNLIATKVYSSTGIELKANQYAIISGIPVGTNYEISEKTRTGFKLSSAAVSVDNADSRVASVSEDNVVSGIIPTVSSLYDESYEPSSTTTATFTNTIATLEIVFKYYDREVRSGTVAHISETETEYTQEITDYTDYVDPSESKYDLSGLINKYAQNFASEKLNNVIDNYTFWSSQDAALAGFGNIKTIRTSDGGQIYSEAYPDTYQYHTNAYGVPVSSGENWVNYYNQSGNPIGKDSQLTDEDYYNLNTITVWFFNEPKKYHFSLNYANTEDDVTAIDGTGLFVGNSSASADAYYNQRLGGSRSEDEDDSGFYLAEYGISGYYGSIAKTADEIDDLVFLYWSSDAKGKNIISTDISYRFRITNNMTLYAIYGPESSKPDVGVATTKNATDVYFDDTGTTKTRLNVMLNPYGCEDNDANIKQASIIYVNLGSDSETANAALEALQDADKLAKFREDIKNIVSKYSAVIKSESVTIDANYEGKAGGFIYDVKPFNDDSSSTALRLTNKNRLQFSTTFTTSKLANKTYIAITAMNYDGDWKVSTNYEEYQFDQNGYEK